MYIYSNNDNVLAVKTSEIIDPKSNNKILSLSNPYNDEIYYKMELNTINSTIVNFEKTNHFPLEQLGFDKNSDNVLNKAYQKQVECDDLGWSDCMDCTVSECGSRWWCVAALVVAGPEVLIGMGVSCMFDQ